MNRQAQFLASLHPDRPLKGAANRRSLAFLALFLGLGWAPLQAQSLLIDVSVSNTTPGASDVFKYKIRYRCASITQHCFNAQIAYTIPASLDIVSTPATGGNVSNVSVAGNTVTISLVSPPSVGAPAGALAAGSSGILETQVRFKCGTNGVAPIPAVGATVNFSPAGLPTFTATGAPTAVAAPPADVITPTVSGCYSPPPPPPPTNIVKYYEGGSAGGLTAGQNSYFNVIIPAHSASYTFTDIFPAGLFPMDISGDWPIANFGDPGGAQLEVYSNGSWYNITNSVHALSNSLSNWLHNVAVGSPLLADGGVNTGSVRVNKTYADGGISSWGSNITGLRITSGSFGSGGNSLFFIYHVDDSTPPGALNNCFETSNPAWTTACAKVEVAPDKPYVYMTSWSEPQTPSYYPVEGNLGATNIPPAGPWPPGYAVGTNNVPPTKLAEDLLMSLRPAISRASEYDLNGFVIDVLLPSGWDFITTGANPNFWTVRLDNNPLVPNACATPTFSRIPNYNGTGRVYLRWEFPTCVLPKNFTDQYNGGELGLLLNTTVRWVGIQPLGSSFTADFKLHAYSGEQLSLLNGSTHLWECTSELVSSPSWTFPTSGSNTDSWKDVKGALDAAFSRYPATGNTNLNGDGQYVMYIKNTGFVPVKQLDVADVLPYIGDKSLTTGAARNSGWSEELANAITLERYTVGGGWTAVTGGELPLGIMYASNFNACYTDGGGQIDADPAQAVSGQSAGCTDMSTGTPAAGAKGFSFRWLNAGDPLDFGEMLRITVNVHQLTGEADMTNGEVAWNSFAYTATLNDDTELFSTEPIKVGLKMVDENNAAAIGDYIWIDGNGNGRQDAGESPVEGVEVSLYDASGNPVTVPGSGGIQVTTLTDATGFYLFPGLTPNTNYYVRLEDDNDFAYGGPLTGYNLTTANAAGVADDADSDAALGTLAGSPLTPRPQILSPTLGPGTQTLTYDFGFNCPGTIIGYVWMDSDFEGDQDGSEMALSGVTATLKDALTNATIGTPQSTNGAGAFTFSNVTPGNYYVEFSNFPGGKVPTYKDLTGNDSNDSDVSSNGKSDNFTLSSCDFVDIDLGLRTPPTNPAAICGTAWDDLDKDGSFEGGEPGVAGVTVQLLDASGYVLNSTVTDANGDYCFTNLDPNVGYKVAFVPPAVGIMFSAAGPDQDVDLMTGVTTATYTPTNNQTINDVDAGFMGPLSIGNLVWNDVNNNGQYDNEPVFANVPVRLIAADGSTVLANTTTDANGRYVFKYLNAGTYYVEVQVPASYSSSADIATTPTPNATDNDDNGAGSTSGGYIRSAVITLANDGGAPGSANWTESDHGVPINGAVDPASNPKAYYTVDFGFYQAPPCTLPPNSLTLADISFGPGTAPVMEIVTVNGGGNLLPENNVAGFQFATTSEGPFYTFCTEISQPVLPIQNPYTHEYNGTVNGLSASVALRVAQVIQAANFSKTTGFGAGNNTVVNFVALQLAVWNALYDVDYSVSNGAGSFYSTTDNNGAIATANAWLAVAQTITAPSVPVHNLYHAAGQNLLMVGNPPSSISIAVTQPTCSGAGSPDNGALTVTGFTNERYRYSPGMAFNSGSATPGSITAIPAGGVIANNLPNTSQNYTVRIYSSVDDNCYVDQTVTVSSVICCVQPSGITFSQVAPTCTGTTPNNNGTISLTAATNGTHYGVSTLNAGSYDGPAFASATAIPALPAVIKSSVSNTGGTYIVRVFDGAADCYTDQSVTVNPVSCNCPVIPCGGTTVLKNNN